MSFEPTEPPAPEVISPQSPPTPDRQGLAIASLVLGALSLLSICLWFCSAPFGLAGIITGILGLNSSRRGLAIAGIVLSAIGLITSVIIAIIGIAFMPFMNEFQNWNFDVNPGDFIP
jgi:hypothetical protein